MKKQQVEKEQASENGTSTLDKYGESREVDLVPKWYQAERRVDPIVFVPLMRSGNLQERFATTSPTYAWSCKLLEPYMLSRDREPVEANAGETFLMFEPSQPGLQSLLAAASAHKLPVILFCDGKQKRMLKSLGRSAELWTWRARIGSKAQDVRRGEGALLLPQSVTSTPPGEAREDSADDIPF